MAKNQSSNITMEELLASSQTQIKNIHRGQEVEGEVVVIGDSELILDLGTKSEGIIPKKEFSSSQVENFKIGDKIKAFVILTENENGQVVLSLQKAQARVGTRRGGRQLNWFRFKNAQTGKSKLSGIITEINKGGLIVDCDGAFGFLPNSQLGAEIISKDIADIQQLIGQKISFLVSEVDEDANKLIFTQKGLTEDQIRSTLQKFKKGEQFDGRVASVFPFGVVVEKEGVRGLVLISEVSWERTEDLSYFKIGQNIQTMVLGVDDQLGRLNLTIKQLTSDPFTKLAEKYPTDEVVKGEITQVTEAGITVALEGAEGFLPASKMDPAISYETGKSMSFLVAGLDSQKRKITLAPFVTSTEGLIYK